MIKLLWLSNEYLRSFKMISSINPANGKLIKQYEEMGKEEINEILESVAKVQSEWERSSFEVREKLMREAGEILRRRKREFAELMTLEMGKPLAQAEAEVEKCAWVCDYYSDNAKRILDNEIIETDASKSFVAYNPLGVVLAIMPWNFPFWQAIRFAVPGIMAGNGGILKHASNVTGSAFAIEEVFREAGFPENLFRTIVVSSGRVADIIKDDRIAAVTLTGSVGAGKSVASTAGSVLKKCVLELGGSDPYLILEDADLDLAAESCTNSRLINSGQSCIAAKRFIVVEAVYDQFLEKFIDKMKMKKMGDPFEPGTEVGPQASVQLRDELHQQVLKSVEKGGRVAVGGEVPDSNGAFYPPTIIVDVKPGMPAYEEELFGPVASVIKAADEMDAIRIANDSVFGLGAAVFTKNRERGERIAEKELKAGNCFVNTFVKSDPRLPFGGIKESGYGRELSAFGIKEFVNIKSVFIK
jgi:succinate-semialdehyde dehydrogenase / glutarate-semialdehyde dehydrogenase